MISRAEYLAANPGIREIAQAKANAENQRTKDQAAEQVRKLPDYSQTLTDRVTALAESGMKGSDIAQQFRDEDIDIKIAYYSFVAAGFDTAIYGIISRDATKWGVSEDTKALHVADTRDLVQYVLAAPSPFFLPRIIWVKGFEETE
jgi:hypothetical protein